jgi:hypothetical protein
VSLKPTTLIVVRNRRFSSRIAVKTLAATGSVPAKKNTVRSEEVGMLRAVTSHREIPPGFHPTDVPQRDLARSPFSW